MYLVHRSSPEIVIEYVLQRSVRPEVPVILDGTNIVEHKATIATVVITHYTCQHHYGAQTMFHSHIR